MSSDSFKKMSPTIPLKTFSLNRKWHWISHNCWYAIKQNQSIRKNTSSTQQGTQMADLSVLIAGVSFIANITASCECWLFLFQGHKDQSNNAFERHQMKRIDKWILLKKTLFNVILKARLQKDRSCRLNSKTQRLAGQENMILRKTGFLISRSLRYVNR